MQSTDNRLLASHVNPQTTDIWSYMQIHRQQTSGLTCKSTNKVMTNITYCLLGVGCESTDMVVIKFTYTLFSKTQYESTQKAVINRTYCQVSGL